MDSWICEICDESINDGEPVVRIAADSAVSDGEGGYESLTDRKVVLFALFHSQCVVETFNDEETNDIAYIWEARDIIQEARLCNECDRHVHVSKSEKPSLKLLRGGLR